MADGESEYYKTTCDELWSIIDSIGRRMDDNYDSEYGFHKPDSILRDIADDISRWYSTQKYLDGLEDGESFMTKKLL